MGEKLKFEREFLDGGCVCPVCRSAKINYPLRYEFARPTEVHGDGGYCDECGASWTAVYVLAGVMDITSPLK